MQTEGNQHTSLSGGIESLKAILEQQLLCPIDDTVVVEIGESLIAFYTVLGEGVQDELPS